VRKEVYLIKCITNVLTKSLADFGFQAIKDRARANTRGKLLEIVTGKLFWLVKRRTLHNALSKWRAGTYLTVVNNTDHLVNTT
jgi:hypothetical protein